MSETKLQIVIDAQNRSNAGFQALKRQLDVTQVSVEGVSDAMKSVGKVGTAAFGAMTGFLALSAREAKNAEAAQFRLSHVLKTATGASDAQVQALNDQAEALERVGVVSAESVTQAQAQLATFDLQAETIKRLTPAILDYVVAEKGANASTEDLKQLTNGLAQALNGNFASLTRVGFVLDDATQALISNGTEAERAAALVSVLNSTYKGMNEAVRQTADGSLVALRNEFGRLQETIGAQVLPILQQFTQALVPFLTNLTEWVEKNPELAKHLIIVVLALTALLAVMLPIGMALPGLVLGFQAAAAAVAFLFTPMGGLVVLLGVLGFTAYKVASQWQDAWSLITIAVSESANVIQVVVEKVMNFIIDSINWVIKKINSLISKLESIPKIGDKFKGIQLPTLDAFTMQRFDSGAVYNDMMSRPSSRAGGGTTVNITGNNFLDQYGAEQIGDMLMSKLKLSNAL